MLTKIAKADVPLPGNRAKSPVRAFAKETVREFLTGSAVGDVAEVTGAPVAMERGGTQRIAEAMRDELFYMFKDRDMRKQVKVITRGGSRLFLERVADCSAKE